MNEKMKCEVVQDLLPLYVDGACTEGSKTLVEEHIKTCSGCRRLLEEMGAPLPLLPVREPTETEQVLRHTAKKLRQNTKRVIAVCLAALLLIPAGWLGYREVSGSGRRISNLAEYRRCEEMLEIWVEQGSAACVNRMTPLALFAQQSRVMTERGVWETYSIWYAGYEAEDYDVVELDGTNYVFPGQSDLLLDREMLSSQDQIEQQELYLAQDELGVLHAMLVGQSPEKVIVTEDTLYELQARYGDLEPERYYRLEWGGETYCFYNESDTGFSEVEALTYPEEVEQVLGTLEPISEEYSFLIRHSYGKIVMPESLWALYEETYETIRANFQTYWDYYEQLGLSGYSAQFRAALEEQMKQLEELGLTVTAAEILSCYSLGLDQGEQFLCRLELGEEIVFAGFRVQENPGVGLTCWLDRFDCYTDNEEVRSVVAEIGRIIATAD